MSADVTPSPAAAPHAGGLPAAEAAKLTGAVTRLSVLTATVLLVLKLGVWWISGSVAVLASATDSALDLAASLGAFFAVRYAVAPPDAEHRFGHGKAEAFASLFQAALVFATAALIGREAVVRLLDPQPVRQEAWAVAVMAVSILLTGLLLWAQTRTLRKTASVAVSGDRAHYLSDLASNAAALIGVGAAGLFGWAWADAAAGLIVAAVLLWGAVQVFREGSGHLMDHELETQDRERIKALVRADPRVLDVHQLRTRASGPFVHIQMHLELDPRQSLEEAHRVMIAAEKRILDVFPAADILIHPDPCGHAEPHGGAFAEEEAPTPPPGSPARRTATAPPQRRAPR